MKIEMTGYTKISLASLIMEEKGGFFGKSTENIPQIFWDSISQKQGRKYFDNYSLVISEIEKHSKRLAKEVHGDDGYFYDAEKYVRPAFHKAEVCSEKTSGKTIFVKIPFVLDIGKLAKDYHSLWRKALEKCYKKGDKPKKRFLQIVEELKEAAEKLQ